MKLQLHLNFVVDIKTEDYIGHIFKCLSLVLANMAK
uniref:Uncharacterized protein n=1 Tax=Anguilla anguilla TaxID=7936 RepID=A0A0E9WJK9_ANGAN